MNLGKVLIGLLFLTFFIFYSQVKLHSIEICKGKFCTDCHKTTKEECRRLSCGDCHSSNERKKAYLGDNLTKFNVHNSKYGCYFCHSDNKTSEVSEDVCFKCHNSRDLSINAHSSNIEYKKSELVEINEHFPLKNGKVVCTTCHVFNKENCENTNLRTYKFLRSYKSREEFCYNCHKRDKYEKYNPHNQIDEKGAINYSTCLVCHNQIPKLDDDYKAALKILKGDVDGVCNGCHQIKGVHPTGTDHLTKYISGMMKYYVEKNFKDRGLNFYIGEKGKIICVTCHYPHSFEEKTLRSVQKKRVRAIYSNFELCIFCHMK